MPHLLSLNVGLPRDVAWQDRTIRTGIWKAPVAGPRMVRRLNIDGDGQGDLAGHGGVNRAVYVYQIASYRYWEEQLGRHDFVYGQFGENFTVEGLPDDEVCIGDRYRIGGAIFEVSQPRVTCYRLGVRMNDPRMPSLLVSHGRPGFYLRVLQEGKVQAGDEIEKIATGPERMTVAEIDALLYLPRRSRQQLARALRIEALSEGWQGSFRELLGAADGEAGVPAPAWAGLHPMQVQSIQRESESVIAITLQPVEGTGTDPPLAGQYLTIRLPGGAAPSPILRTYSLSGPPDPRCYRIGVKHEPGGVASSFLHTRLRVGDILEVGAPRGSFTLVPGERPVVLISAGVGATPVLAMLNVLAAERTARPVWWIHGARDGSEHAFRSEVEELLHALPNTHRVVCYSRPRAGDRLGRDYDVLGHVDTVVLEGAGVPADADFYLCGPGRFMHDVGGALAARGVLPDRVKSEIFGPQDSITPGLVQTGPARPPHPPDGEPGTGAPVTFARSNLSVPWQPACRTLLEFAEACDVAVRWACRTGVCHTCETGLLSGSVAYELEPLELPAAGNVLICCSRPVGEVLLDL